MGWGLGVSEFSNSLPVKKNSWQMILVGIFLNLPNHHRGYVKLCVTVAGLRSSCPPVGSVALDQSIGCRD